MAYPDIIPLLYRNSFRGRFATNATHPPCFVRRMYVTQHGSTHRSAGVAHFPPPSMPRTLPGVGASLAWGWKAKVSFQ